MLFGDMMLFSLLSQTLSFGLFAGGESTLGRNHTRKYTYAGDAISTGSNLNTGLSLVGSAGSGTVAIITGGTTTGLVAGRSALTNKYTYSTDASVGGTSITTATHALAATGTETTGYFAGGFTSAAVATNFKYTYSGDSVSSGTSLQIGRAHV